MAIPENKLIARTILSANVLGGSEKESVVLAEYLTGKRSGENAIGILAGIYPIRPIGDVEQKPLWVRDYGEHLGGGVSRGQLAIVDLDGRSPDEMLITVRRDDPPGTIRVIGEILSERAGRVTVSWTGSLKVDSTGPRSTVEPAERERFVREIDYARTSKTRGGMIIFRKTVSVAAGVPVDPPRVLEEAFPLDRVAP
jgi:hypothetical protein